MQAVQRGANNYENDDRLEIVDFRQTLQKCFEDDDKVYGAKNKPRAQDPSMFELLSWKDDEEPLYNYTKKDKEVIDSNPANKLKYKINKSSSHWVTENMDQFRKFTYSPSKKAICFDLDDPANAKNKLSSTQGAGISRQLAETLSHTKKEHDIYLKEIPQKASETIDKYSIRDLNNLQDVLKVIENRAINRDGDVVKNPIAEKITERLSKSESKRHGGHYRDYEYDEEEDDQDIADQQQEEPEEDVKVEKQDFSNVKSRLLQSKVKKAKVLDPVYEKERLDRRKERIKRLNETTRWLPNSAFKTYFGKPPFENYGRGNINPTVGGSIYGDYLKSHNVNPHAGSNKPEFKQVYTQADFAATRWPDAQPEPPRKCKDDFRLSQNQVDELKRRNPLVPDKFKQSAQGIVKPDLVNSLRFASEENTPDVSFEEEKKKSAKPKSLAESLKQLNKTTKAIRKEGAKQNELVASKQKSQTQTKPKKAEKPAQAVQESPVETQKSATVKKSSPKQQPASEKKPASAKAKTETDQRTSTQKQVKAQERVPVEEDIEEFENPYRRPGPKTDERAAYKYEQQFNQRPQTQQADGVRDLMQDPNAEVSPQTKKGVSFKAAPQAKSAVKYKEAPGHETSYGKVEDLQTLLKETQKNEKIWERINEDTNGTVNVNPMEPPKNYLFSLSQKETDPRYYKNVPAVWMQRIPYAGVKNPKHEDVKEVFNYC